MLVMTSIAKTVSSVGAGCALRRAAVARAARRIGTAISTTPASLGAVCLTDSREMPVTQAMPLIATGTFTASAAPASLSLEQAMCVSVNPLRCVEEV